MVNKNFRLSRILKIVFETFFYSIVIYFIFLIFGGVAFSFKDLIYNMFPIYFNKYWFVTAYMILLILSPAINIVIKNLNKKTHLTIVSVLFFIMVITPYIHRILFNSFYSFKYLNQIFWFLELYLIAGYIKIYGVSTNKFWLIISILLVSAFQIVFSLMSGYEIGHINALGNSVLSVLLLLLFKDLKFHSKFVNVLASTTFAVYLIHEHNLVRNWWWNLSVGFGFSLIGNYILTFFICVPITFVLCSIIDLIRINTVHRLSLKLINKIDRKFEEKRKI
jgi:hypothetical protein